MEFLVCIKRLCSLIENGLEFPFFGVKLGVKFLESKLDVLALAFLLATELKRDSDLTPCFSDTIFLNMIVSQLVVCFCT